jgi:hypothetical protein
MLPGWSETLCGVPATLEEVSSAGACSVSRSQPMIGVYPLAVTREPLIGKRSVPEDVAFCSTTST